MRAASNWATVVVWVSSCWRETMPCCTSVCRRFRSARALSRAARSLANWPSACMSWTWKGRGSISARSSPWRTIWPSVKATRRSWPSTRLFTVTLFRDVTVPSPVRLTAMSPLRARATVTGTARPAGLAAGSFLPPRAKSTRPSKAAAAAMTQGRHPRRRAGRSAAEWVKLDSGASMRIPGSRAGIRGGCRGRVRTRRWWAAQKPPPECRRASRSGS